MARSVLVINGPNLNLLGTREPGLYGATTLPDLDKSLVTHAHAAGAGLQTFQSNWEGAIIDRIHQARGNVDAIIINAAAFTHSSVALRDALLGVAIPFIEVHITNVHTREAFRHHSYLSDKAVAVICGLGTYGYTAALEFVLSHMKFA